MWDFPTQTDKTLEHNRSDITVINKKSKKCILIDPACPFDTCIPKKEKKGTNYSELKYKIAKLWKMKKVEVIPVVIVALGTVTKEMDRKTRLGLDNWNITEALFTRNHENNAKGVGYEMKKF